MRKAFSLVTAIMFIVLVGTIGALALTFSTQTSKQTVDVFMKAQAELLSRSATEYAILAVSAHEINAINGCVNRIDIDYSGFDAQVIIKYIGNNLPNTCNTIANDIATEDSKITMLIDTYVKSQDGLTTEPIRVHRRTLQKM